MVSFVVFGNVYGGVPASGKGNWQLSDGIRVCPQPQYLAGVNGMVQNF
jgi:hypothetical protein